MLSDCPKSGTGKLDHWINQRVLQELHRFWDSPDDDIFQTVKRECRGCGRNVDYEIRHSIATGRLFLARVNGWEWNGQKYEADTSPRPQRVEVDFELQRRLLKECAAPGLCTPTVGPLEALQRVFGQALVCAGVDQFNAKTAQLDGHVFRGNERWLRRYQFIVPNPMSKRYGRTKDGLRWSEKTLDNTGERRHVVVEFDGDLAFRFEEQWKLLWHLGQTRPLVMVVHSGNKSLHGWYQVHGLAEAEVWEFFRYAESIGADHEMWSVCQFTRIPGGVNRKTGREQKLMFFNQ
jgi:hypothetical protein